MKPIKRTCGTCAKVCGVAIRPETMQECVDGWTDKRAPLPCPRCGAVPVTLGEHWLVYHKRGCFDYPRATIIARSEVRAWNRRAR